MPAACPQTLLEYKYTVAAQAPAHCPCIPGCHSAAYGFHSRRQVAHCIALPPPGRQGTPVPQGPASLPTRGRSEGPAAPREPSEHRCRCQCQCQCQWQAQADQEPQRCVCLLPAWTISGAPADPLSLPGRMRDMQGKASQVRRDSPALQAVCPSQRPMRRLQEGVQMATLRGHHHRKAQASLFTAAAAFCCCCCSRAPTRPQPPDTLHHPRTARPPCPSQSLPAPGPAPAPAAGLSRAVTGPHGPHVCHSRYAAFCACTAAHIPR